MATELDLDDVAQYSPLAQRELADLRAELANLNRHRMAAAYLDLRDGVRELADEHEIRPGRIHGDFARGLRALLGEDDD